MSKDVFQPDWFSVPGETLASLLAKRSMSLVLFAEKMGFDDVQAKNLLSGLLRIDLPIAGLLSQVVGGSIAYWISRQEKFDQQLDAVAKGIPDVAVKAWLKTLPIRDMEVAGWIEKHHNHLATLKAVLSYFGVVSIEEWQARYADYQNNFSFRTSPTFDSKVGALSAWLRQGELQAASTECSDWAAEKFSKQLENIRGLTKTKNPSYFIPRLRQMCASAGVAVVFVKAPPGCRASGATRFISRHKAMIILSFRYLSDDHFWFTFFHEAGHLLLHGQESVFVDGDIAVHSEMESEANAFSAGILVPLKHQENLLNLPARTQSVVRFAVTVGVSPGIVVGQMQHMKVIAPNQLNRLKRRYSWDEITQAMTTRENG